MAADSSYVYYSPGSHDQHDHSQKPPLKEQDTRPGPCLFTLGPGTAGSANGSELPMGALPCPPTLPSQPLFSHLFSLSLTFTIHYVFHFPLSSFFFLLLVFTAPTLNILPYCLAANINSNIRQVLPVHLLHFSFFISLLFRCSLVSSLWRLLECCVIVVLVFGEPDNTTTTSLSFFVLHSLSFLTDRAFTCPKKKTFKGRY